MQKINTLVALLGLSLLMSGVARSAENTGLGLSQVKAALVDAAMQQGVSVVSNAYVDSKGELIESSFFRSGAIVRGIRMPQYFSEDPYDAEMLFADTAFNSSLSCQEIAPHRYSKAISIDTSAMTVEDLGDSDFSGSVSSLQQEVEMSLVSQLAASDAHTLVPLTYDEPSQISRYEAALDSRSSILDPRNTNYTLRAEVINVSFAKETTAKFLKTTYRQARSAGDRVANEFGFRRSVFSRPTRSETAPPYVDFELRVALIEAADAREIASRSVKLRYVRAQNTIQLREPLLRKLKSLPSRVLEPRVNLNIEPANAADLAAMSSSFGEMIIGATRRIGCGVEELVAYQSSTSNGLTLNQGQFAGVSVGDQFILSESNFSTSQNPISSSQLENLAIARVISVDDYSSDLQIVEGPAQALSSLSAIPF
jgi:hypothetical protein